MSTAASPSHSYVLFFTSNHAFRAEKLLRQREIPCKLVPVPRHFSSECGVCLRIDPAFGAEVSQLLAANHVEIDAVRSE